MYTLKCAGLLDKHNLIAKILMLVLVLSLTAVVFASISDWNRAMAEESTTTEEVVEVVDLKEASEKVTVKDDKKPTLDSRYYVKKASYTNKDVKLLASIIYCEAGCEGYQGQLAVGSVVLNRVESNLFPNSIKGVVYQSGQFSPVANGALSRRLASYDSNYNSDATLVSCVKAAKAVLDGRRFIVVNKQKVAFKNYLFFSRSISGAKFRYKHHDFK